MAISVTFIIAICVLSSIHYNSVQGILNESKEILRSMAWLSKQTQPLLADACQNLGYNGSSEMNFAKVNQSEVANNAMLKALMLLQRTECSKFVMSFACAIFQPHFNASYRAVIPPCRSVCNTITKSCAAFLQLATQFLPFSQGPCKLAMKGRLFRGKVGVTKSGIKCQSWNSQFPHKHWITAKTHPYEDLAENYCRNPDGEPSGPWCYTTSKYKRWEYCDVPMCRTSLRCHWLPSDGCVDFKYNKTSNKVEAIIKGTPKKSNLLKFLKFTSIESITKWLEFLN